MIDELPQDERVVVDPLRTCDTERVGLNISVTIDLAHDVCVHVWDW